jgi:hypothetical protein
VRGSSLKVPEKCPDYYGICPDILKKSQNKNPLKSRDLGGLGGGYSEGRMVKTELVRVRFALSITSSRRIVP